MFNLDLSLQWLKVGAREPLREIAKKSNFSGAIPSIWIQASGCSPSLGLDPYRIGRKWLARCVLRRRTTHTHTHIQREEGNGKEGREEICLCLGRKIERKRATEKKETTQLVARFKCLEAIVIPISH